ncbi:MAG: rhomboid family intramembrane serine protease, partial [Acidimicrobiia bacterium]|nr:rhomboid family intramembrane serine protease [Acidimicrobiia bacterium]
FASAGAGSVMSMWLGPDGGWAVGASSTMYFASAGAGSVMSMWLGPDGGWAVGASGAIFGLFGAWLFVAWRMRHSPGGRAMFNQLLILMAINVVLPFLVPGIDWLGHVGGFVGGTAIAALWSVFAVGRTNARVVRTAIGAGALAVVIAAAVVIV